MIDEHYKASLPEEKRARWDAAMREYELVVRRNFERRRGAPFTDAEWAVEAATGDLRFTGSYQPGHSKSALFARLLEGRPALPLPPPLAYSYPWYEAVEAEAPIDGVEVAFEGERASAMTLGEYLRSRPEVTGAIGVVQINQSMWSLLERTGDVAIVTYGEWAAAGYRWRISWVDLDVDQAPSYICCWHDRSKERIRTGDELWAESSWHVMKSIDAMRRVSQGLDPELSESDRASKSAAWLLESARATAQREIKRRTDRGWPAVPGESAIRKQIKTRFSEYLHGGDRQRPRYRIAADGRLRARMWRLERIAPKT